MSKEKTPHPNQTIGLNLKRAGALNADDLHHIADFRKIVLNYLGMKKAITHMKR